MSVTNVPFPNKLSIARVRELLDRTGEVIDPSPHDQRKRPGKARKREVILNGELCGVHYLRNMRQRRPPHGVAYATTLLNRTSIERQKEKIFIIEAPGYARQVVRTSTHDLLKLFPHGADTKTIYFPLQ